MILDTSSAIHALSHAYTWLNGPMEFIASILIFLSVLVLLPLFMRKDGLRPLFTACIGVVIAILSTKLIGSIWYEPRPFVTHHFVPLVAHAANASFPSDHLAVLGALTIAAWCGWKRLGIIMGGIAILVAFARVYAGIHYVHDVVGGAVLGALCSSVVWYLLGLPICSQGIAYIDGKLHAWDIRRT